MDSKTLAALQRMLLAMHPFGAMLGETAGGAASDDAQTAAGPITPYNTSQPGVERALLEAISYGRQLDGLMRAVEVLLRRVEPSLTAEERAELVPYHQLRDEIAAIKQQARARRVAQLRRSVHEITALHRDDPEAFAQLSADMAPLLAALHAQHEAAGGRAPQPDDGGEAAIDTETPDEPLAKADPSQGAAPGAERDGSDGVRAPIEPATTS